MQSIDAKLRSYQHNASKRGYGFTLTREEFISLWQKPCHYCGIEIKSVGLDRVDNAIGYVFSNVVSCCSPCNYAKGDLTAEQFFAMCKRIVERHCD